MYRSLLFTPGHKIEYIKDLKFFPDILVIDLEDSVSKDKKNLAFKKTESFLNRSDYKKSKIYIRINFNNKFIDNKYHNLIKDSLDGIILPKVKNKKELIILLNFVKKYEKLKKIKKKIKISFIAETTQSIINLNEIIKSTNRIEFIIYGEEDYHSELNNINFAENLKNNYAKNIIPILAKANHIQAIFTPYLYLKNSSGLKKHILESIMFGYSGLLLIHPKQISLANKLYMPSIKDIKIANQIINSNKSKKYEGQNISVLKNKLIGPPMIKRAEKILNLYKKK
tara:strand:+ start:280 stop:1128 length:849 start_codon:yes stop_codon:yes gene_type:complete